MGDLEICLDRNSSVADLTFAAERLGADKGNKRAEAALWALLGHRSPIVREGAIRGIQEMFDGEPLPVLIGAVLETMAECDESPGVRSVAAEALEDQIAARLPQTGQA